LVALCRAGLATPAGIEKEKLQNQPVRRGKPRLQKRRQAAALQTFLPPAFPRQRKRTTEYTESSIVPT